MNPCLRMFVYITYLAIKTAVAMQRWVTEDPSTVVACTFCIGLRTGLFVWQRLQRVNP